MVELDISYLDIEAIVVVINKSKYL